MHKEVNNVTTNELLKNRRKELNLTMKQVADFVGVSEATVSRWESGNIANMGRDKIALLSQILKITPGAIAGYDSYQREFNRKSGVKIPVLGLVRAGIPMDAVEYIIDYEEISEDMARQGEFFALQIKGDSMEPKISDGDVVIVRKQPDIESGETAIVLVNGDEATIKKVQKFTGGINLIPSNPAYDVMTFTNEQIEKLPVRILGKVVELRAKF